MLEFASDECSSSNLMLVTAVLLFYVGTRYDQECPHWHLGERCHTNKTNSPPLTTSRVNSSPAFTAFSAQLGS